MIKEDHDAQIPEMACLPKSLPVVRSKFVKQCIGQDHPCWGFVRCLFRDLV